MLPLRLLSARPSSPNSGILLKSILEMGPLSLLLWRSSRTTLSKMSESQLGTSSEMLALYMNNSEIYFCVRSHNGNFGPTSQSLMPII
ncbi:hypothetical protein EUGRSUZ_G02121 [Eucalyptus grandis]|uniref:Uncharacterized protein n=2 Tax=Eucalyptus grandis TaxID=71139 RepID=A0ACC3K5H3_EUCGR|nr:hypothetical protein EUGRSUZ_G02121 [Eucalyptus grandis]